MKNEQFLPTKEGPTSKPNSSKLGTCQGQRFFYLGLLNSISKPTFSNVCGLHLRPDVASLQHNISYNPTSNHLPESMPSKHSWFSYSWVDFTNTNMCVAHASCGVECCGFSTGKILVLYTERVGWIRHKAPHVIMWFVGTTEKMMWTLESFPIKPEHCCGSFWRKCIRYINSKSLEVAMKESLLLFFVIDIPGESLLEKACRRLSALTINAFSVRLFLVFCWPYELSVKSPKEVWNHGLVLLWIF